MEETVCEANEDWGGTNATQKGMRKKKKKKEKEKEKKGRWLGHIED